VQFLTAKEQVYIINLSMRDCLRENDKYTTTLISKSAIDVETGKCSLISCGIAAELIASCVICVLFYCFPCRCVYVCLNSHVYVW
jgi:hypothetical protein